MEIQLCMLCLKMPKRQITISWENACYNFIFLVKISLAIKYIECVFAGKTIVFSEWIR